MRVGAASSQRLSGGWLVVLVPLCWPVGDGVAAWRRAPRDAGRARTHTWERVLCFGSSRRGWVH